LGIAQIPKQLINPAVCSALFRMADTAPAKKAAPAKKEKKPVAAAPKAPKAEVVKKAKEPSPVTPRPFKRYGRLWGKAVFTGFKRGLRNQHENHALLKVSCANRQCISFVSLWCLKTFETWTTNVEDFFLLTSSPNCMISLVLAKVSLMLLCYLQVEGSRSRKTSLFYVGKRCAFVFKGKSKKSAPTNPKHKTRLRAIWGKVTRLHGNNGSVRARFTKNLPGDAIGKRVRIVSSFVQCATFLRC